MGGGGEKETTGCLASGLGGSVGSIISGRKDLGDEGTAKGPDAPKSKNEKLLKSEA